MANPEHVGSFAKPLKGEFRIALGDKRAKRTTHEQREMQAAKKRDGHTCRVPRCEFTSRKLHIDAAHQVHRGMGGNAKGDRTTRATVISLCVRHHQMYDHGQIAIEPLTHQQFDGPCSYFTVLPNGQREHYATERLVGISEPRT
jgi:hypothetical protein